MKKRLLEVLYVIPHVIVKLFVFVLWLIPIALMTFLFPIWGIVYIIWGFNYVEWVFDTLYEFDNKIDDYHTKLTK